MRRSSVDFVQGNINIQLKEITVKSNLNDFYTQLYTKMLLNFN